MQRVLVDVDGEDREVATIILYSCTIRPPLNYRESSPEGLDSAPHRFDSVMVFILNLVVTSHYIEVSRRSRAQRVFEAFREAGYVITE